MLSSHFFPCHFMVLLFSPRVPNYLSFFFPLELSGFALRVTAPLIVLAVWKMVRCSLSVGSLLLNAASGTPEHLDRSIGLSWLYFPHSPHPGDVRNNWRKHMSLRVTSWSADPDRCICGADFGREEGTCARGWCVPGQCRLLPRHTLCAASQCSAGVWEGSLINSSPFAGALLLSVGTV